ncbi:uncharacterized protein B0I36DRAFT_315411 [Microdochium trichocladiopsis]|uniref:Protein FAF1 n=1 Tax=Microdochium trichocladiopsis TaxID=1682393 RepID=A0A9P8YEX0_9PEZI|nr:uncharacterized protein B0I36DRAFT_315411 [Microdochium trichocladiopsis]KAH7038058.1 hypothetical protein B0I36DRAFT_315411 [Microdochium trichocladiopsis]
MSASVLGKRKARTPHTAASDQSDSGQTQPVRDAQAIFQRYFEAQFKPLEGTAAGQSLTSGTVIEDMDTDSDDDDGGDHEANRRDNGAHSDDDDEDERGSWSGVSDLEQDDTTPKVEVVSHVEPSSSTLASTLADSLSAKKARKALLSSKVPSAMTTTSTSTSLPSKKSKSTATEEDAPTLLKNDLELQRLLSESHLFNPSKVGTLSNTVTHHRSHDGNIEHVGRNRLLATDLRMAALGSKTSIYAQAKMPMSHRKGINAAAISRENKRRREARENGIILERPSGNTDALKAYTRAAGIVKNKNSRTAQGRGNKKSGTKDIDAPAVGRLRDGMLKLSKKDIHDIQSSGERRSTGKGRKGKRR